MHPDKVPLAFGFKTSPHTHTSRLAWGTFHKTVSQWKSNQLSG